MVCPHNSCFQVQFYCIGTILRNADYGKGKGKHFMACGKGKGKGRRPVPLVPCPRPPMPMPIPATIPPRPKLMPTSVRHGGAWMQCYLWVPFQPGASPQAPPTEVMASNPSYMPHPAPPPPPLELPTESEDNEDCGSKTSGFRWGLG